MTIPLDRQAFLRPIAHRGLHDAAQGRVENAWLSFAAAIAKGYGIECDVRPAAGGRPIVFHDETVDRLIDGAGPVAALKAADLKRLRYRANNAERISTFADFLDLVAGKVPLLVEVKSEWEPPGRAFMRKIAELANAYRGPLALMSFDPAVMIALKDLAPTIPRGIVSGLYEGDGWWRTTLSAERAFRLAHLLESGPVAPSFYAYHIKALPTPVTRYVREVQGLPLFTWTVRTADDRARTNSFADAPIFEGFEA